MTKQIGTPGASDLLERPPFSFSSRPLGARDQRRRREAGPGPASAGHVGEPDRRDGHLRRTRRRGLVSRPERSRRASGGPGEPRVHVDPSSLANVYLNRYENGGNKADLERSLQIFEWVAAGREALGRPRRDRLGRQLPRHRRRPSSGGVRRRGGRVPGRRTVADGDEDHGRGGGGAAGDRWSAGLAVRPDSPAGRPVLESILPFPEESAALASRVALFAAASSFVAADPRAGAWAENALIFAARIPTSVCPKSTNTNWFLRRER